MQSTRENVDVMSLARIFGNKGSLTKKETKELIDKALYLKEVVEEYAHWSELYREQTKNIIRNFEGLVHHIREFLRAETEPSLAQLEPILTHLRDVTYTLENCIQYNKKEETPCS
jgi:hypothetical protein